jgi:hypothetical protein
MIALAVALIFEAHSGFWMNLHHALYATAQRARAAQGAKLWMPPDFPVHPTLDEIPAGDQDGWKAAVAYYSSAWAGRDLLLDDDLAGIKSRLAAHEADEILSDPLIPLEMQKVLNQAAPIYRESAWPAQTARNLDWFKARKPDLDRLGPALTADLSKAFAVPWPSTPIRVDLVPYGGGGGAYTSLEPTHITIATGDPRNQGNAALETLFHEAAHGMADPLRDALAAAAKKLGVREPRDLWHATLFFTVGEIVRRHISGYVPYAVQYGLWKRAWPDDFEPLQKTWIPCIDGKVSMAKASEDLLSALPRHNQSK